MAALSLVHHVGCVFCEIAAGTRSAKLVHYSGLFKTLFFEPLNPVTPGHVLAIPYWHFEDALDAPLATGQVMQAAAAFAQSPCNLITSVGKVATQTVFHFHVHIVPRREGDGLHLPWTGQEIEDEA